MSEEQVVQPAADENQLTSLADTTAVEQAVEQNIEQAQETAEETEEHKEETKNVSQEDFDKAVKKRVAREKQKTKAFEQEAHFWREEALKHKAAQEQAAQQKQTPVWTEKPTMAMFNNNLEQYTDAVTDWKMQQLHAQQEQARAQQEAAKVVEKFNERQAKFAKENPDYDEVVADMPQVHNDVIQAIAESKNGPAVAYYLAKNPDAALELRELSPARRLLEVGKIEAKIIAQNESKAQTKAAPKAPAKAAPAPVNPVSGKAPAVSKSIYEMTREERMAHFREQNNEELKRKRATFGRR